MRGKEHPSQPALLPNRFLRVAAASEDRDTGHGGHGGNAVLPAAVPVERGAGGRSSHHVVPAGRAAGEESSQLSRIQRVQI